MSNNHESSNFIKNIMTKDLQSGKHDEIITRFPPEPNGLLHIGHAKAITVNFELADEFGGYTNLRFDDTNPLKEDKKYVDAIKEDIKWLGFQWENLYFASDYFEEMYNRAVLLIKKGKAYVDDLSPEEIREYRGTLKEPGKESPYRDRPVEENLDLFDRMRKAEFENGEKVLRAKIDMSSSNLNMRDPILYRISHSKHHNTGDKWCIYPMYDFAHPLEDAIEGITHSLCSIEFEDHRPLYNWVVEECEMEAKPRQIEFARLKITNTNKIMSKRYIRSLVEENIVDGWDDPRLPTIRGLRRRGYTPTAIREFCREIGVAKKPSTVDKQMLEHFIREDLKINAPRTLSVIRPLKVVITNYPEDEVEMLEATNNRDNPELGSRKIPFSNTIYIEREDFMENPPKKYKRLSPGVEVRLKFAYFIKCEEVIKDPETGEVIELRCTYDPKTKSGTGFKERKPNGTIHWVDGNHSIPAEIRLYDDLILDEQQVEEEEKSFLDCVNPNSLEILQGYVEANMKDVESYDKFQFYRHGYFSVDPKYTNKDKLVFNRTVPLKSSFKLKKK